MTRKKIEKEYYKKIKKLTKLNKFYYEKNNPIVDDKEYDILKKSILKLESEHSYLKSENSPSVIVGFHIECPCFHLLMLLIKMI
jgi:DNA ligase (NAD+)